MKKSAAFSPCRNYRYALYRVWDDSKPLVLFICLNPSTADESFDDPTLSKCMAYAKAWGYGGVSIGNLFAYRATSPKDMRAEKKPIGPENDPWLDQLADEADLIIAAWGNHGTFMGRSQAFKTRTTRLHYLKLNQSGEPTHPLYLKSNLKPLPFTG